MAFLAQPLYLPKTKISFVTLPHLGTINICSYIQNCLRSSVGCLIQRRFLKKHLTKQKIDKSKHKLEKLTVTFRGKDMHHDEDAYFISKNNKTIVNDGGNFLKEYPLLAKLVDQDGTFLIKSNLLFVSKMGLKKPPLYKPGHLKTKPASSTISASHKSRWFNLYPKTYFCGIPASYGTLSKFLAHPGNFLLKTSITIQNHLHTCVPNLTCGKSVKEDKCSKKNEKDNLTAVLYGINDLKLEQRPIPKPKDAQVLLQVEVVGICGSDVHFLLNGRLGPFVLDKPMVIGHEASGTVVKVGKSVKNLKEGDRVAIEPGTGCRMCNYCKTGKYNLCPDMAFCATPPTDGNLARFYVHAADFCFKLPKHVSLEEGALLEPLSCGVHACKRGHVTIGSTVLILGAGPIGLTSLLAAKAFGASRVVITDLAEHRLKLAKELGADCTVNVSRDHKEEDVIEQIKGAFNCEEPTVSIECSGSEMGIRIALQITKAGGSAILIGMGKIELNLPFSNAIFKEVDIKGVFRYVNNYPTSLEMVASGKVNVLPLVTHEYKLEDTLKAFETAKTGEGNAVKILIHPNPKWKGGSTCKK